MKTNKPRVVSVLQAAPLHNDDSATFIGRVREVINVIRSGQTAGAKHTISGSPKLEKMKDSPTRS
jgi:hypothetical protein